MRPLKRHHVGKHKSARKFRRQVSQTKMANLQVFPTRGGWRM